MSGLDIQLEKSAYDSPVRKKIGCRWQNTTSHNRVFQKIDTSQWLSGKGESSEFGDMGSIPDEC